MASVLSAISSGYPSRVILNHLTRRYPQHAQKINDAYAAGYTADVILKQIAKQNGESSDDTEDYLTEHEKTQRRDAEQKRKAALQVLGTLGTAGAVAAGGLAYANRNRAVRPTAILPPLPQQQAPRGLPGPQTRRGLPAPNPRVPGPQTPPPGPQGVTPTPPQLPAPITPSGGSTPNMPIPVKDIQKSVDLVKNIQEDTRFSNIIQSGFDTATTAAVLKEVLPKNKVAILEKQPGGLEKIVQDYTEYHQANPPAIRQTYQPRITSGKENQELEPIAPQEEVPLPQESEPVQEIEKGPLRERVQQAAFTEGQARKLSDVPELKRQSFAIPNYRYKDEPVKDFMNRKILYDAVNKAANALKEGKSFLDFPINEKAVKASRGYYSTDADVLRFMAGIPNIYDPLLDEDEKQELMDSLLENGQIEQEGMRPSKGERAVHGAQMTPSLVWNLILSIEPRISHIEKPPSVKGAKMAPGQKMGTTELRRFLTHAVYGVLSGKNISNKLSDKIEKISAAANHLDAIVNAAKDGNIGKLNDEMEKLMDDDYFMKVMREPFEDALKTPEQEEKEKEDIKQARSIKSEASRKRKKEKIE